MGNSRSSPPVHVPNLLGERKKAIVRALPVEIERLFSSAHASSEVRRPREYGFFRCEDKLYAVLQAEGLHKDYEDYEDDESDQRFPPPVDVIGLFDDNSDLFGDQIQIYCYDPDSQVWNPVYGRKHEIYQLFHFLQHFYDKQFLVSTYRDAKALQSFHSLAYDINQEWNAATRSDSTVFGCKNKTTALMKAQSSVLLCRLENVFAYLK